MLIRMPAATAEPITPATLGPMACMRPAGALRDPQPNRGAGAGRRRAGRGTDHGFQTRQQERM